MSAARGRAPAPSGSRSYGVGRSRPAPLPAHIRLIAALALPLVACGGEGLLEAERAPDVSGTYSLVELNRTGVTLSLPLVSGTLVLQETSRIGGIASGTYLSDITLESGRVRDRGRYSLDGRDGSWRRESSEDGGRSRGAFEIDGPTLAVEIARWPAADALRSVWFKGLISDVDPR